MARHPSPKLCSVSSSQWKEACLAHDLPLEVMTPLRTYVDMLMRWNSVMNLVGARAWRECLDTLLVDSFHLAHFLRSLGALSPAFTFSDNTHTWDLGAGAGLPGIPLRLLWQEGQYHLVEAREKRALFLSTVLANLPLPRTFVFRGRAEDFFVKAPCKAHMVVSRAFLPWREVLDLVQGQVQPGGHVIFLTLEGMPASLPEGWEARHSASYTVGKGTRWFWAIERKEA